LVSVDHAVVEGSARAKTRGDVELPGGRGPNYQLKAGVLFDPLKKHAPAVCPEFLLQFWVFLQVEVGNGKGSVKRLERSQLFHGQPHQGADAGAVAIPVWCSEFVLRYRVKYFGTSVLHNLLLGCRTLGNESALMGFYSIQGENRVSKKVKSKKSAVGRPPSVTTRQIAVLKAVAENGSYNGAARALGISAGNVHTTVARLSRNANKTLIDDASRSGVTLTREARTLLKQWGSA